MQAYENYILDADGEPIAGASVAVYQPNTTTEVTIYSDNGVTTTDNPLTTNSNGRVKFYAASQRVDLYVHGTGISTPYTVEDIILLDPFTSNAGDSAVSLRNVTTTVEFKAPTAAPSAAAAGHIWEDTGVLKHGASSKSIATLSTAQTWPTVLQNFTGEIKVPTAAPGAPAAGHIWIASDSLTYGANSRVAATLSGTQTLTGDKTFTGAVVVNDGSLSIKNTASQTKIAAFSAASITAGNTRTMTVPDASGTLALLSGTQTFTGATTFSSTVALSSTLTVTSNSANALTVGRQGATAPALKIDASTASSATGMEIVAAAATGGVNLRAISSGADENLTINAKGSGTVNIAPTSTGAITLTRATTCSSTLAVTGAATLSSNLIQGSDTTDRVTIKGIYMSPANVTVAVPAITDPDIAKVDVSVAAAFSMQPAVGDGVLAIPQEAMEANARILGCYVTATDQVTVVFGSEGGNVTGGNKSFKFIVFDVT